MQAIETFATIDNQGFIHTKQPLAFRNKTAKIIILINEQDDEIDDSLWLKAATHNPVFDFLDDEAEDIYSVNDGSLIALKKQKIRSEKLISERILNYFFKKKKN